MSSARRKIGMYSLRVTEAKTKGLLPGSFIHDCLKRIIKLPKDERKVEDTTKTKFHFLDYYSYQGAVAVGYFKSAKYNHRPPLINRVSLLERDNPKVLDEGDSEKTHFSIGIEGTEALLMLESKGGGVSVGPLVRYLNIWARKGTYAQYLLFSSGNFLEKLQEMARATAAEIYTSNKIVSQTFGRGVEMAEIKDDIILTMKAKTRRSIKEPVKFFYRQLSGSAENAVSRIRIVGKTPENELVLLDTDRLTESEYIDVQLDDNKQVVTDSILPRMRAMVRRLL